MLGCTCTLTPFASCLACDVSKLATLCHLCHSARGQWLHCSDSKQQTVTLPWTVDWLAPHWTPRLRAVKFLLCSWKWQSEQLVTLNGWLCGKTGGGWACVFISLRVSSHAVAIAFLLWPWQPFTAHLCSSTRSTSKKQVTTKNTFPLLTRRMPQWGGCDDMTHFSHLVSLCFIGFIHAGLQNHHSFRFVPNLNTYRFNSSSLNPSNRQLYTNKSTPTTEDLFL